MRDNAPTGQVGSGTKLKTDRLLKLQCARHNSARISLSLSCKRKKEYCDCPKNGNKTGSISLRHSRPCAEAHLMPGPFLHNCSGKRSRFQHRLHTHRTGPFGNFYRLPQPLFHDGCSISQAPPKTGRSAIQDENKDYSGVSLIYFLAIRTQLKLGSLGM
jgi:hypothetical protein